jgi:hypothetical protein
MQFRYIIVIILAISFLLAVISQYIVLGDLEVDTKIGPADASLDAEFYEHGVNYVIIGNMSSGGLIGGISGGLSLELRENKTYLTGLGEFQENIGLILNSYKDKSYQISTSIQAPGSDEFKDTKITVENHNDLIPWWPQGLAQRYTVTITYSEVGNSQKVVINEIRILLWRDLDTEKQVYLESSKPIERISPDHQLTKLNESKKYDFDVTISGDYGTVGLIAVVDVTIIDSSGNEVPENAIINLGKLDPVPAGRTNNVYTMDQGSAFSIVLMVAAFPITIVSMIFMLLAIPFIIKNHRTGFIVIQISLILLVLSIVFFVNGIETLVTLIDSVLDTPVRENFQWSANLVVPILAIILLILAAIFSFIIRPAKEVKEKKKKGRGKGKEKAKDSEDTVLDELPIFEPLSETDADTDELVEFTPRKESGKKSTKKSKPRQKPKRTSKPSKKSRGK